MSKFQACQHVSSMAYQHVSSMAYQHVNGRFSEAKLSLFQNVHVLAKISSMWTGTQSINITSGHSFFSAIIAVLTHGVTLNFDNGMRLLEKIAEDIYFTLMGFISLWNGSVPIRYSAFLKKY